MLVYFILWIISLIIGIFITRAIFEISKFSKRSDELVDAHTISCELLRKQNDTLTLLLHASFENKKIGLINKSTSSVKMIDITEI